jgi:hypothetical protein
MDMTAPHEDPEPLAQTLRTQVACEQRENGRLRRRLAETEQGETRAAQKWSNEHTALTEGRRLVQALRQACDDTGNPAIPTPMHKAIQALAHWANLPPR